MSAQIVITSRPHIAHLSILAPHFGVHPTEHLAVEVTVRRVRHRFCVGLPSNLDSIVWARRRQGDLLWCKGVIEGVQM